MEKTMIVEIKVESPDISLGQLKHSLEVKELLSEHDITLELRKSVASKRNIDPSILVAVVGAAGAGIGALITGIFAVINKKKTMYIEIHFADGGMVKAPADINDEELDMLIEKAKRREIELIELK
jgi:hypothetical protein